MLLSLQNKFTLLYTELYVQAQFKPAWLSLAWLRSAWLSPTLLGLLWIDGSMYYSLEVKLQAECQAITTCCIRVQSNFTQKKHSLSR